jgi:hypothetical protein
MFPIYLPDKSRSLLDIEKEIQPYFEKHATAYWAEYGGGAAICYQTDLVDIALIFHFWTEGVAFLYAQEKVGDKKSEEWASVSDPQLLSEFLGDDSDGYMPKGSFFSPEKAWQVVTQFLYDPIHKPESVEWIETSKLNWPEP